MRACSKKLAVRDFPTRCVLDKGHDGSCRDYVDVLKLRLPSAALRAGAGPGENT